MLSHLVVAHETAQAATGIPTNFTFSSAASIVAPFRPLFQAIFYSWFFAACIFPTKTSFLFPPLISRKISTTPPYHLSTCLTAQLTKGLHNADWVSENLKTC